jgi:CDP-glucose 4,6-dehydratase
MGGYDPYSNSKGCAELVTSAYINSYFNPDDYAIHQTAVASARAGNVIGGGDWASDRLIPDLIQGFIKGETVNIRSPKAIRPWQHVLEPLSGYIKLAESLYNSGTEYTGGWNFGPSDEDVKPVSWIVEKLANQWGENAAWKIDESSQPHEAHYLKLDCSKANIILGWQPKWKLEDALVQTVKWFKTYQKTPHKTLEMTLNTIHTHSNYQATSLEQTYV